MYKKNYRDLKNVDGTYSIYNFFRRIFQLIDIKRFLSFRKAYAPEWGGGTNLLCFY